MHILFSVGPEFDSNDNVYIIYIYVTGLASDDVKLVLSNNSVPGYGHTHVHKDWKILCRTQALLRE